MKNSEFRAHASLWQSAADRGAARRAVVTFHAVSLNAASIDRAKFQARADAVSFASDLMLALYIGLTIGAIVGAMLFIR